MQHLACRPGERRVQLDIIRRLARDIGSRRKQRLRESCRDVGPGAGGRDLALHARQQGGDDLLEQARIAPEQLERLVEQHEVLAPRHEDGRERSTKVRPVLEPDRLHRGQRVDDLRGPDRDAARA